MNIIEWFQNLFNKKEIMPVTSNLQSNNSNVSNNSTITLLSLDQFTKIFPETKSGILYNFIGPLNNTFIKYNINTPKRIAAFLGQIGEESEYFQVIEENLNYSASELLSTFPTKFNKNSAVEYSHQPEKIANRVYANKYMNGDESSGDGWKFRGRGAIQLTFKENYIAYSNYVGKSLEECINYLENYSGAVDVAGWYWNLHSLNSFADQGDIETITRKINGGTYGLSTRESITTLALKTLTL